MNILTSWLRHYLPTLPVTDRQLADDLTLRGIAVEGVHSLGPNNGHLFEMDITTNRVDAMNHYGIAREAATIYNLRLSPLLECLQTLVILSEAKDPRISSESTPTLPHHHRSQTSLRPLHRPNPPQRHHRAINRPGRRILHPPQPETNLERR